MSETGAEDLAEDPGLQTWGDAHPFLGLRTVAGEKADGSSQQRSRKPRPQRLAAPSPGALPALPGPLGAAHTELWCKPPNRLPRQ